MSTSICGFQFGGCKVDEEGQRDYTFYFYVASSDGLDGPAQVLQTSGLPEDGAIYNTATLANDRGQLVGFRDVDEWAWCRGNRSVTPVDVEDEKPKRWKVEFLFSTKPQRPDKQRCMDNPVTDPLLEPPKVTFGHTQEKEAATLDRFGNSIDNSAHEPIRGPQVEFDADKPTIVIEQNVGTALQGYILPTMFANCVNQFPLWGLPPRTIKLVPDSGSREYYGQCFVYYKRKLTFAIERKTWDRWVLDEGTKVLAGDWVVPSPNAKPVWVLRPSARGANANFDPSNFIKYLDPNGTPGRVVLNGRGLPSGVTLATTGTSAAYMTAVTQLLATIVSTPSVTTSLIGSVGILNSSSDDINPAGQQAIWFRTEDDLLNLRAFTDAAIRNASFPSAQLARLQAYSAAITGLLSPLQVFNVAAASAPVSVLPSGLTSAVVSACPQYSSAATALSASLVGTGSGTAGEETGDAGRIFVTKYDEADFLLLGIPATF